MSSVARVEWKDDQKALFNAGYIEDNMSITKKGRNRLLAILYVANKKAFVESAEAEIAEAKEQNE